MSRLIQLMGLARVAKSEGGRKAIRRWRPFSITAFEMMVRLKRNGLDPRTIIDGGANTGQFARAAIEMFENARVIAIEPLPDAVATLRAHLKDSSRATIIESAIGDHTGVIQFHHNEYSLASSILPLHSNHLKAYPNASRSRIIDVPITMLDTLFRDEQLDRPALLKLDLQGFELPALKGAVRLLEDIDHVLLEMAVKEMYSGQASFDDLYDFLREQGFRFVAPVDVLKDPAGDIVQMDVLFAKMGNR